MRGIEKTDKFQEAKKKFKLNFPKDKKCEEISECEWSKFKDLEDNLFLSIKKVKNPEKLEKIIIALFKMNDAEEFKVFIEKTIEVNPKHT